jgi:hypothetical protein
MDIRPPCPKAGEKFRRVLEIGAGKRRCPLWELWADRTCDAMHDFEQATLEF